MSALFPKKQDQPRSILEHLEPSSNVVRYFETRNNRAGVVRIADPFAHQGWPGEMALVQDLSAAKKQPASDENTRQIAKLRGLIRALSWQTHQQPTSQDLTKTIDRLREMERESAHQRQREAARLGEDADDEDREKDAARPDAAGLRLIQDALDRKLSGAEAEEALHGAEELIAAAWHDVALAIKAQALVWEQTKNDRRLRRERERIGLLRIIRDQLAFQRLAPSILRAAQ